MIFKNTIILKYKSHLIKIKKKKFYVDLEKKKKKTTTSPSRRSLKFERVCVYYTRKRNCYRDAATKVGQELVSHLPFQDHQWWDSQIVILAHWFCSEEINWRFFFPFCLILIITLSLLAVTKSMIGVRSRLLFMRDFPMF